MFVSMIFTPSLFYKRALSLFIRKSSLPPPIVFSVVNSSTKSEHSGTVGLEYCSLLPPSLGWKTSLAEGKVIATSETFADCRLNRIMALSERGSDSACI